MKKVLVAGAALMMAGALVVPAAWAEITLGGDARVRYVGGSGYDIVSDAPGTHMIKVGPGDYADTFRSRVRLNIRGVADGGAFAQARLRLGSGAWDGTGSPRRGGIEPHVDFAFVGLPMGAVTVYAGMVNAGLADFSDFFYEGGGETRVQVAYDGEGFNLTAFYQIDAEGTDRSILREQDQDDASSIGLMADFSPADNMNISTFLWYMMDDHRDNHARSRAGDLGQAPRSGFQGTVRFEGDLDALGLEGELSFRAADLQDGEGHFRNNPRDGAGPDDGVGGYVGASFNLGAFTPGVQLGFTSDGFTPTEDYGFIMLGGDSPIAVRDFGGVESSYWLALTSEYEVSERLSLSANMVYLDMDNFIRGVESDAFELSGALQYTVSAGATLGYSLGFLFYDVDNPGAHADLDLDAIGHFVQLNIRF